ncbi:DNA-directed RNA polymerase alpha chain rpoA [Besnoitia besnoiti]|uniref:DNA-directed RNA polymerase alpha chain rpoA n=1 Tax=Besnoitia besnoiti TaxID=94643 RepID=A0A2A9MJB6_BESBE|nr:DNA-directed RNA polymerase alpha chain rpoA [Besnoitia besnoiti]PFH38065.1 DNA-directed RNA polymerase alpha chain rpoA [Besnoitia besnoiti]
MGSFPWFPAFLLLRRFWTLLCVVSLLALHSWDARQAIPRLSASVALALSFSRPPSAVSPSANIWTAPVRGSLSLSPSSPPLAHFASSSPLHLPLFSGSAAASPPPDAESPGARTLRQFALPSLRQFRRLKNARLSAKQSVACEAKRITGAPGFRVAAYRLPSSPLPASSSFLPAPSGASVPCAFLSSACLAVSAGLDRAPVKEAFRPAAARHHRRVFSLDSKVFSRPAFSDPASLRTAGLAASFSSPSVSSSLAYSAPLTTLRVHSSADAATPSRMLPRASYSGCSSSSLHAEGEIATAAEREAPYPSFLVPSPHPPPPAGCQTWQKTGGYDEEDELIRRKAEAWRVDRSAAELDPEDLEKKIAEEKKELQQRWRARLDVEHRRNQDYFEQQREQQRELLNSLPAPPWVHVFRPVYMEESPPLKYDFRVYQPFFQSLIEASKPFIQTKLIPPSAIQRFLERRHFPDSALSSGFRFKQIQPLFAHNAGCSAFFYFHTCFSALAPAFLNALRRTSISRLEALAITAVKIEGAKHEFYSLPGIREDIVDDIFNNLGKIILREKKVVYVRRKEIYAWLESRARENAGAKALEGHVGEPGAAEPAAAPSGAANPPEGREEGHTTVGARGEPAEFEDSSDAPSGGQAGVGKAEDTSSLWKLLPPGTTLVARQPEAREEGWASWMASAPADSEEDSIYYRIPLELPAANFTQPLRAKLRVRGPLVAVAGHIQLPEGVEVVNKNQYLFTVNSGYYVNMDFKIERIREYVMPEFGYDSLERDRDEEGFMYFTNYVAPVPVFAYAAERRGEAVHTKWDSVDETAPPGAEAAPDEHPHAEDSSDALLTQVQDVLRQATADAPPVVKSSLSSLLGDQREPRDKEAGAEGYPEGNSEVKLEGDAEGAEPREEPRRNGRSPERAGAAETGAGREGTPGDEGQPNTRSRFPALSSACSRKEGDRYNAYRFLEPTEELRNAYRRDYLDNDLPYQNLGEVVTLEVQTDGSLTPREALLRCCDDLIKQVLDIQDALNHNCHVGVDGTEEEEYDDPDWYQDAHRYVGVPWNPYKKPTARAEKRQDFFFKADVLRQYNILREKMDARREAFASSASSAAGEAAVEGRPRVWPLPGRGMASDVFVASSREDADLVQKGDILREKEALATRMLAAERSRLQQDSPAGLGPRAGATYGLSERELEERLLDEEEEEERTVNTSLIIRKEREEAWQDKQRTYRDLAENEPLKQLGDGKGLVKYPPDTKPMMEAPSWVMEDPMGQRMPIGFSEFNDD